MNRPISRGQQALHARIAEAREKIADLEKQQRAIDNELEGMAAQRQRYQLLEQVCASLDALDQAGAASLFWGERAQGAEAHVGRARDAISSFSEKIAAVEQSHKKLQDRLQAELETIGLLTAEIEELEEEKERQENEFVVHREVTIGYRPMVMPWQGQPEDERRLRKAVFIALLVVFVFAFVTKVWKFPPRDQQEVVEIPKQLVKLVQAERPKPPPPEQKPEQKEEARKDPAKATPQEKQQARAKAEKSGVLAFKSGFADLIQDSVSLKLGADANISTSGQKAVGNSATRSLVTAQGQTAGSGGIRTASLSRDVGGTGSRISGVTFTRVESGVAGMKEADRPLTQGPGPSRTDEEIQIVFDRYKAALYRIYQRELRNDPTLRGKMVLKITIEPNGSVSACVIQSSDLASAALKNEVVDRVKKFNFGAKDGVPRIAILYPIDFLPAS